MTSKELVIESAKRIVNSFNDDPRNQAHPAITHTTNKESNLKCGSVYEIDVINDELLDEYLQIKKMI